MIAHARMSDQSSMQHHQLIDNQERDGARLIAGLQTLFQNQADRIGSQSEDNGAIKQHMQAIR